MPRGFYQGWSQGVSQGMQARRNALAEELGRGRMMLEEAAEERNMRRQQWLEEAQRERGYEEDFSSYRRLSEQYPEAGAEGLIQGLHESSRRLARDPAATVPAFTEETFQPIRRPLEETRREDAEELMRRFGEAKKAQRQQDQGAKMREALTRRGRGAGGIYMKDVEQYRREAAKLREAAFYLEMGRDIAVDPQGRMTLGALVQSQADRQKLKAQARKARVDADRLEAAAEKSQRERQGFGGPAGAPRPDEQEIYEILRGEGYSDEEVRAYMREQGLILPK